MLVYDMQTGIQFSCRRIAIPDRTAASQSPPKPDWGQNIVSEEVPETHRGSAGTVPMDVKSQRGGAGDLPGVCQCGAGGYEKPKRRCRGPAGGLPIMPVDMKGSRRYAGNLPEGSPSAKRHQSTSSPSRKTDSTRPADIAQADTPTKPARTHPPRSCRRKSKSTAVKYRIPLPHSYA